MVLSGLVSLSDTGHPFNESASIRTLHINKLCVSHAHFLSLPHNTGSNSHPVSAFRLKFKIMGDVWKAASGPGSVWSRVDVPPNYQYKMGEKEESDWVKMPIQKRE